MAMTQARINTKQDVIEGLEFLCDRAEDIVQRFTEADWQGPGDHGGWTARQVYSHVAGLGALIPPFTEGYVASGPDVDMGPSTPIHDINAGLVNDRKDRTPRELGDPL